MALQPFSGNPNEDVADWTANAKFLIQLYRLDEQTSIRVIFAALKGNALSWARGVMTKASSTTSQQLLADMNTRFLSSMELSKTAIRFLSQEIPKSAEKYLEMIKEATYLYDNDYMSFRALFDRIILRSPPEIRISLWNVREKISNFFEFSKAVVKIIPLAYGSQGGINLTKKNKDRKKPLNQGKWCDIHGSTGHSTLECYTIKKLRENGWARSNQVKSAKLDENSNKENLNYFLFFKKRKSVKKFFNIFLLKSNLYLALYKS